MSTYLVWCVDTLDLEGSGSLGHALVNGLGR